MQLKLPTVLKTVKQNKVHVAKLGWRWGSEPAVRMISDSVHDIDAATKLVIGHCYSF